jgi:hypothetical protein
LGKFCAVGGSGANRVMTSSDGVTWVSSNGISSSGTWNDICWSAELGKFCAVSSSALAVTASSSDGVTWATNNSGTETNSWLGICWSPN